MFPVQTPWLAQYLTDGEWISALSPQFQEQYFIELSDKLEIADQNDMTICPPKELIFNAFNQTPLSKIKVVILGQEPYKKGQAMGLAFSVPMDVHVPRSLLNIFEELERDPNIEFYKPSHGCLTDWAQQGVFLLNTILTAKQVACRTDIGWKQFTDHVIKGISYHFPHVVFILMGNDAHEKAGLIDQSKHKIISTSHPSPISATRGQSPFKGSNCFSVANDSLTNNRREHINWQI